MIRDTIHISAWTSSLAHWRAVKRFSRGRPGTFGRAWLEAFRRLLGRGRWLRRLGHAKRLLAQASDHVAAQQARTRPRRNAERNAKRFDHLSGIQTIDANGGTGP